MGIGSKCNVVFRISSELDIICQGIAGRILGIHVPKTVIEPPLSLLRFGALGHGKVCPVALVQQGLDVFVVGVLVKDRLGPFGLMGLKHALNDTVRHGPGGPPGLPLCLDLSSKCHPEIVPERAVLSIEHVSPGSCRVCILQFIAECQRTFIVDSDGRIRIIQSPVPFFF